MCRFWKRRGRSEARCLEAALTSLPPHSLRSWRDRSLSPFFLLSPFLAIPLLSPQTARSLTRSSRKCRQEATALAVPLQPTDRPRLMVLYLRWRRGGGRMMKRSGFAVDNCSLPKTMSSQRETVCVPDDCDDSLSSGGPVLTSAAARMWPKTAK